MPQSYDLLSYLVSVTARSLVLFAVAALALLVVRAKSAAARHAVWTVVVAGMLALAALSPFLPPLPLPVLQAVGSAPAELPPPVVGAVSRLATPAPASPAARFTWGAAALGVYVLVAAVLLARLGIGWLFTRRLLRAATPAPGEPTLFTSNWISVPLTVGRKVLLPADWTTWSHDKLDAVLAHEGAHVRRRDWAIALLAGVNRSLFWFHPLAWWVERRLATLAEQACDDSALLTVGSRPYAQALLDMAAAVRSAQGRLEWEAMAMAKASEVRQRIELILDETRQIPRGLTRARWAALVACSAPLIWLVSATQLVPANAQQVGAVSTLDAPARERHLAANPNDVEARSQLILHYYATGNRAPRIAHIIYLIENHPSTPQAIFASQGMLPRDNSLNTHAEYQRVLGAWRQAAARNPENSVVLASAARFLQSSGEFDEAEKLLMTGGPSATGHLAQLYALAILGATGDPAFTKPNNSSFAPRVQRELEASDNVMLRQFVGQRLRSIARRPQNGQPLPPGVMNLDDHPLLLSAIDFGERLVGRASPAPSGVLGGIVGSVPIAPIPPTKRVAPEYPPLARQARISGVVKLNGTIGVDGTVKQIEVVSGHPLLVPAALQAFKQWTFPPQREEVRGVFDIPFIAPTDGPAAAMAQEPRPAVPQRIRVGGNVHAARLVRKSDPVYPPQARGERIEGDVTLSIVCGKDGQVIEVTPVDGNPVLAGAAVDAVRLWVYQPTLLNGEPVEVATTVVVPFRLQ